MPWDDTTLVVADLVRRTKSGEKEEISIDETTRRVVAGGPGKGVSAMEPVWFSDPGSGEENEYRLAFISDETGWWNVYAEGKGGGEKKRERERVVVFLFFFPSSRKNLIFFVSSSDSSHP